MAKKKSAGEDSLTPEKGEKPVDELRELLQRVMHRKDRFERGWWKRAEKAQKMYDEPAKDEDPDDVPFNILYANTEILLPSLYSATPRPDCVTRGGGKLVVAQACEKMAKYLIDDNSPGTESFDQAMEGAVLSALVPGCGGVRIRHFPNDPCPIRWEEFKYNQLVWGYARTWSKVPWLAFIHPMTKSEIQQEFSLTDEDMANKMKKSGDPETAETRKEEEKSLIDVYEVWIKSSRKVVFLCDEWQDVALRQVENDPLGLSGFYPTPGLLTLVRKPSDLDPVPLIDYYRNQAEELNRVTVRLNKVLSAIRVRGAYNPLLGDTIQKILETSNKENALVAADKPLDLQASGGFDKHIWLLPIDMLVTVARELYNARQQILQVIYQITGLADIVRGATVASETATAQELKSKWGSVRLRRMQRTVQIYVRSLLRLAIDGATSVAKAPQWADICGLPLMFAAQKQQAELQYQQVAAQAEQMGQQPPPPPDALLQPSWEELIKALSDDPKRQYELDIETASTLDTDATADKEEVVDFMQAFGQLLQGLAPLTQLGPAGIKAAKAITLAVAQRFKLGREVEGALKALPEQAPQSNQPSPEQIKADTEKAKLAAQQQSEQAQRDHEAAMKQQDVALAGIQHKIEMARLQQTDRANAREDARERWRIKVENETKVAVAAIGKAGQEAAAAQTAKGAVGAAQADAAGRVAATKPPPAPAMPDIRAVVESLIDDLRTEILGSQQGLLEALNRPVSFTRDPATNRITGAH